MKPDISASTYVDILKKNSEMASSIMTGCFYSFKYDFDKSTPIEKKRLYDNYPLIFMFDVYHSSDNNKYVIGLNFHQLPVESRMIWYSRINKLYQNFLKLKRLPISYSSLYSIFKKSVFSVRQYNIKNMKSIRKIKNDHIKDLLELSTKTYMGTTLTEISSNYRKFIPPN